MTKFRFVMGGNEKLFVGKNDKIEVITTQEITFDTWTRTYSVVEIEVENVEDILMVDDEGAQYMVGDFKGEIITTWKEKRNDKVRKDG